MPKPTTETETEEETAGGSSTTSSTVTTRTNNPVVSPNLQAIIGRYGTMENALLHLASENYNHRRYKRDTAPKIEELEKIKTKSVILSGEDRKAWERYKALGKVEEVEKRVQEHASLTQDVEGYRLKESISPVAEAHGFNKDAVTALIKDKQLKATVRDRTGAKDGEPKQEILITEPGEGKTPVPFSDYAKTLPVYVQAGLTAGVEEGESKESGSKGASTFIKQTPADSNGGASGGKPRGSGTKDARVETREQLSQKYLTPTERARAASGQQ